MNLTEDSHPIHLHLVRFQILDRQLFDADEYNTSGKLEMVRAPMPPPPNEAGWKDTVRVDPGTITRIIVKFEGYTRPLRLALPPARARRQRDDAPLRGGRPLELAEPGMTPACWSPGCGVAFRRFL